MYLSSTGRSLDRDPGSLHHDILHEVDNHRGHSHHGPGILLVHGRGCSCQEC